MKQKTKWERKCPNCNKLIIYKNKKYYNNSIKNNRTCVECRIIKTKIPLIRKKCKTCKKVFYIKKIKQKYCCRKCYHLSNDVILKNKQRQNCINNCVSKIKLYGQWNVGKHLSIAHKEKIGLSNKNKVVTENTKLKISKSLMGHFVSENTKQKLKIALFEFNKGKTYEEIYGKIRTIEEIKKRSKPRSIETRRRQRLAAIKRIELNKNNGNQISPNYNKNSIPILEQKAKELEITDLQHAENGGEFYLKELGYWADGYSKEKNIWIEIDEKYHEKQKEKDKQRQKEIEEFLKCKFIRIKC